MKSTVKLFISTMAIFMILGVNAAFASREKPSISINNEKMDIYASVTNSGTTLVPMRPIFEKLGMTVDWDNKTKSVTATKGGTSIKLSNNSNEAYVNGKVQILNQAPSFNPDNSTFYVNLRFIAETLKANVEWKKTANAGSININFPAPGIQPET